MLNELFKLFSSSKNDKSKTYTPGHLVMQTIYGAPKAVTNAITSEVTSLQTAFNSTVTADVESLKLPDQNLLSAQTLALKKTTQYSSAEFSIDSLSDNTLLIGFTRHLRNIKNGIIMYPPTVRYTDQWESIKEQAKALKTNIAYFRPTNAIECLKIINPAGSDQYHYLVDHRFLTPEKSLLQFDKTSTNDDATIDMASPVTMPAR